MPVAADALGLDVVCWIIVGVALISVAATYAYREAERRWGMALPGQIDGALPNSKLSPVMERGLRLQEYAQAMAGASPVAMPLGNVISGNIINESELGHSDDKMLMDDGESVSMMQRAASTRRLPMFDGDAMHGAELDLERRELRPRRPSTMLTRTLARLLPTDTFHFPRAYWVLVVILNCVTTSTVSFLPMAPAYFEARYFPGDAVTAATYVSLPDTISGVMLPIVGYLACRGTRGKELTSPTATTSSSLHRKAVQIVASALSVLMAHLLFAYGGHNSSIVWPLIAFGCGYTLYSSVIYSLMSELVLLDDRGRRRRSSEGGTHGATASDTSGLVATAYGVAATTLNITSVIVPMLVAELLGGGSSDGELLSEDAESPSSETHASAHTLHTRIPASAFASMQSFYVAVAAVGVVAALFLEHALRRNQPRTG